MDEDSRAIENWWDVNAQIYQDTQIQELGDVSYGLFTPPERRLGLLGNLKGKRVIDLGCGGGQNSIVLANRGAIVTALDVSSEQLKYARSLARKAGVKVKFVKQSILDLRRLEAGSYDAVFSAYALQFVPNLDRFFRQVARVLKPSGFFVFSLEHPLYSILDPKTLRIREPYARRRDEHTGNWTGRKEATLVVFRSRFSDILNGLARAGFYVETVVEESDLTKYRTYRRNTKWRWNWGDDYPLDLIKMVPTTVIFKARKSKSYPALLGSEAVGFPLGGEVMLRNFVKHL